MKIILLFILIMNVKNLILFSAYKGKTRYSKFRHSIGYLFGNFVGGQ